MNSDMFQKNLESDLELTDLMTRKGIYPYSFMDSFDNFDIDPMTLNESLFQE